MEFTYFIVLFCQVALSKLKCKQVLKLAIKHDKNQLIYVFTYLIYVYIYLDTYFKLTVNAHFNYDNPSNYQLCGHWKDKATISFS